MELLDNKNFTAILEFLEQGRTIIFPTETTYGLGCDATNQSAVDVIFKIKGRPSEKPLLVVVPTVEKAREYILWNDVLEGLATKFWPGALTIVGEYKNDPAHNLAQGVVSRDGTVAVRVTPFPFLEKITTLLQKPLVATSANLSGAGELYDPAAIERMFASQSVQPDALVDAGMLPQELPTTIVSVVTGTIEILRQGALKIK